MSSPSPLKHLATTCAIALFRATRAAKRHIQSSLSAVGHILRPVGRLAVRLFILPVYRLIVTTRLRIHHLALPARGFVLFFITNRYILHVAVGVLSVAAIVSNIQGRQVHAQDVGQQSLLFAMATDERTEISEEIVRPEQFVKDTHYVSNGTLGTIPDIDFDYEEAPTDLAPSITIPGTIAVLPFDIPVDGPRAPRTKTETYVVKNGDSMSSIAHQFGINVGTILWNNKLTENEYIRPGDTLRIPPVSGIIATVKAGDTIAKLASRYGADGDEIIAFNGLGEGAKLAAGNELMIPGGRPPELEQTRTQIVVNTKPPASSIAVSTRITNTPKPADLDTKDLPTARLLWPTSGHVITQYYGWKHTGVDIDGDYSSAIYAAADGTVEKAGWNSGGYGLMILIDSPGGIKTRYGHASKMFVKAGDTVKRGQVIAMVGTTGRSTGTHLHFEVYVKDKRTNPLSYIR